MTRVKKTVISLFVIASLLLPSAAHASPEYATASALPNGYLSGFFADLFGLITGKGYGKETPPAPSSLQQTKSGGGWFGWLWPRGGHDRGGSGGGWDDDHDWDRDWDPDWDHDWDHDWNTDWDGKGYKSSWDLWKKYFC